MRPTIGSKSAMLSAYGYRQPSQPTTSKGWVRCTYRVDPGARADQDLDVAALHLQQLVGGAQVAFAVRGVLEELAPAAEVLLRRPDVAPRLEHQDPQLGTVDHPAVHGRGGDDDVVARADPQAPEAGLQLARAGLDEDQLVTDRVAGQGAVGDRGDVGDAHVLVGQQQVPPRHDVPADLEVVGLQVPGRQRVVGRELVGLDLHRLDVDDRRRRLAVVQQRRVRREALGPRQLLGVQAPVGAAELGVTLARHLPELAIVRHARPFVSLPAVMRERALSSRPRPLDARACKDRWGRCPGSGPGPGVPRSLP